MLLSDGGLLSADNAVFKLCRNQLFRTVRSILWDNAVSYL